MLGQLVSGELVAKLAVAELSRDRLLALIKRTGDRWPSRIAQVQLPLPASLVTLKPARALPLTCGGLGVGQLVHLCVTEYKFVMLVVFRPPHSLRFQTHFVRVRALNPRPLAVAIMVPLVTTKPVYRIQTIQVGLSANGVPVPLFVVVDIETAR